MDFDDSPEEVAFRAEANEWLSRHARLKTPQGAPRAGLGDVRHKVERSVAGRTRRQLA